MSTNLDKIRPLITRYKELAKLYQRGLKARKHKVEAELPLWYVPTEHGLKFMPGVLAEEMEDKEKVFYAAEQHYIYRCGVYQPIHEMEAQKMVREKMLPSETKMNQITDVERQWRLLILEQRYLCFKTWEQISVDMGYSIQHTFRLHDKALKEVGRIYEDES